MHIPCQTSKKHQSGLARTNREEAPRRWSDSPQVVARFAPGGGAIWLTRLGGKIGDGSG